MALAARCPECETPWTNGHTCQGSFYQMLGWESERPSVLGEVHHLMVLCYHLQHPSLYSPEGLSLSTPLMLGSFEWSYRRASSAVGSKETGAEVRRPYADRSEPRGQPSGLFRPPPPIASQSLPILAGDQST